MLKPSDLRGVYAIIPTPAKDGADRWDAVDTVDLAETERVVNRLIGDGVHGLIVLGTTGECATLTGQEYEAFVDCVLATVKRGFPPSSGRRRSERMKWCVVRDLPRSAAPTASSWVCRCGSR